MNSHPPLQMLPSSYYGSLPYIPLESSSSHSAHRNFGMVTLTSDKHFNLKITYFLDIILLFRNRTMDVNEQG
jgi:hypothetical protein